MIIGTVCLLKDGMERNIADRWDMGVLLDQLTPTVGKFLLDTMETTEWPLIMAQVGNAEDSAEFFDELVRKSKAIKQQRR